MKSRRKSKAARGRKRNAKGHFVKASSVAAPRRRRAKHRSRVAATTTVAAPRRRKARRNPWSGQPRRHAKAAKKGWRKRKRAQRAEAAPRRRRKSVIVRGRGRARRTGAKRSTPINIRIALSPARAKPRKPHAKPRKHAKPAARRPRAPYTYTPASHQLAADSYALSNPLSGGELVLVGITGVFGYGLADFVGRYMETAAVASGAAMNSVPAGATVPNDVATTAFPSWQAIASQFGVAAVPMISAAFVDSPWGRAALQGAGLGAGFCLFGGLFKSGMASLLSGTPLGQQLYLAEFEAQAAVTAAAGTVAPAVAPATSGTGVVGLPRGVGRRAIPVGRGVGAFVPGMTVVPRSQPAVGGPGSSTTSTPGAAPNVPSYSGQMPGVAQIAPPPGIMTNGGNTIASPAPGTVVPGGVSTGPMCAPCTSTSGGIAATHASAMAAIRDESCLGAMPRGFDPSAMFPD